MATRSKALTLTTYREKRDFARTPEPAGLERMAAGSRTYVIQKHDARRLHFDFRLELDGVLKSWAVTRGPSLDPSDKRLAIRTEDHPIEYGGFEGVIPKGEYGGGPVMLWDRGTWEPQGDPHEGLEKGLFKFVLHGERLNGGFALVRLRADAHSKRENWLLVKERDGHASPGFDPVEQFETSVDTGRDFSAILHGKAPKRLREPLAEQPRRAPRKNTRKPGPFIEPQLATLVETPPTGPAWIHEIKFDGYRIQAAKHAETAYLYARSGQDWTAKLPHLAAAIAKLPVRTARLDGEIVVLDDEGRSSFQSLQQALKRPGPAIVYHAFDLLECDGEDIRDKPLEERKKKLARLIQDVDATIRMTSHIDGDGHKVMKAACEKGLEGIVSKRRDKGYVSGRGTTWLKAKCLGRDEFVIGGFRASKARGRGFASLVIGEYDGAELKYRGRVGTGFDDKLLGEIAAKLEALRTHESPFGAVPRTIAADTTWVQPRLVAEITYTERTADGILRHASFIALRQDKAARQVTTPKAKKPANKAADDPDPAPAVSLKPSDPVDVHGVRLTHPDKVLYPGQGITKLELANYLDRIAPLMLPFVAGHPLSLVRCPEGSEETCFFQKHRTPGLPPAIGGVKLKEGSGKSVEYVMIDSAQGLVSMAQIGALEVHVWGATSRATETPDRVVFDLDPHESVSFSEVRDAAREFQELLAASGLTSFPLLTGGKGIHVIAPLTGENDWSDVKAFARGLAAKVAGADPERYVNVMSKAKRTGRIFIDWLRNDRGATAIAPYSPRARAGAPLAWPVSWRQLGGIDSASAFTVRSAAAHPPRTTPWTGYADVRQSISPSVLKTIGGTATSERE